jgi:hypothetical protein
VRRILVLLAAGLLAVALAAPASVAAAGSTYQVPKPHGHDDTAAVQAGLDWCAAHGPGCTVQLQAGTYRTRQLVEYNFRGTFRGAGQNRTTIQALPHLAVTATDYVNGECLPNLTDCRWPSLIVFVDGSIAVSDLSIREPWAGTDTTTGFMLGGGPFTALIDALRFMGQARTDVSIDRVSIASTTDPSDGSCGGYSVCNGVIYTGELPRSSTYLDYSWLTGSLSVRNSTFSTLFDGVSTDGFARSQRVTIGGSRLAGNTFSDVNVGIDLEASQGSVVDVSHNTSTGNWAGMWVVPWLPEFAPNSPSQYLIHDNTFVTTGWADYDIQLFDNPASPWIRASIWSNRLTMLAPEGEGVDATFTTGTVITDNTITGSGAADAIGLFSVAGGMVAGNNVSGTTLAGYAVNQSDPGLGFSQIHVGTSMYTTEPSSHVVVKCSRAADTVTDLGTSDKILGCTSVAAPTLKAGAAPAPKALAPAKGLPKLHRHLLR